MSSDLQPPTIKTHELEDAGAHELGMEAYYCYIMGFAADQVP